MTKERTKNYRNIEAGTYHYNIDRYVNAKWFDHANYADVKEACERVRMGRKSRPYAYFATIRYCEQDTTRRDFMSIRTFKPLAGPFATEAEAKAAATDLFEKARAELLAELG